MKLGRQTVEFEKPISIECAYSSVGKKEADGPFGNYFDKVFDDELIGKDTWEKAESELLKETIISLMQKNKTAFSDIDYIFSGDLLNQCTSTNFAIKDFNVPHFGIFGACSTFSEGISLGSFLISGGFAKKVICATSSHFCTAEKQFRYPIEYGSARCPTSQWTVTGSGAVILSDANKGPFVTHITTGRIMDLGVTDANNMGAAMAPAAADTILAHFKETGRDEKYYDLIVTGDLGSVGMKLNIDLLKKEGIDISNNYNDCGNMIFNQKEQSAKAGGSGCGCCASMFCGYFYKKLLEGEYKNILFVPTGALLSPISALQGESIPSIAHAVAITM